MKIHNLISIKKEDGFYVFRQSGVAGEYKILMADVQIIGARIIKGLISLELNRKAEESNKKQKENKMINLGGNIGVIIIGDDEDDFRFIGINPRSLISGKLLNERLSRSWGFSCAYMTIKHELKDIFLNQIRYVSKQIDSDVAQVFRFKPTEDKISEIYDKLVCGWNVVHLRAEKKQETKTEDPPGLEFDLDQALAGAPVITRRGLDVEIIGCSKNGSLEYPVVAKIEGPSKVVDSFTKSGRANKRKETVFDLFMKPTKKKKTLWIKDESFRGTHPIVFDE